MIIEIDIIDIRNEDSLNLIRYLTLAFFGGGGIPDAIAAFSLLPSTLP